MEFIKTEKGWVNSETNTIYPYGTIALKIYNSNRKNLKNIMTKLEKYYSFSADIIVSDVFIESVKRIMSDEQLKELKAPQSNGPYLIIGKQDVLEDFEKEIFEKDQNITAIMLYHINSPFYVEPDNCIPFNKDIVYIPLHNDDVAKIFNTSEIDILKSYRKISNANALIDQIINFMLRGYEVSLVGTEFYTRLVAAHQNCCAPLLSSITWHEHHYYDKFIVNTNDEMYALCDRDILELINYKFSLEHCPICNELFVKRDGRVNFCPKCSADKKAQKKYNEQKRKRNTIQIEHKAIVDMLRNRNEDYNDFVNESYYYKDLIEGKEISMCPDGYNSSIQTEKQYEEWLKMKHKELTKRPKKHPAR